MSLNQDNTPGEIEKNLKQQKVEDVEPQQPKQKKRRKKVVIGENIGHLCHDEPVSQRQRKKVQDQREGSVELKTESSSTPPIPSQSIGGSVNASVGASVGGSDIQETPIPSAQPIETPQTQQQPSIQSVPQHQPQQVYVSGPGNQRKINEKPIDPLNQNPYNQQPFFFSEHAGSEFSSLNEFLSMLDDPDLIGAGASANNEFNLSNNNNNLGTNSLFNNTPNNLSASHSLTNLSLTNLSMLNTPILGPTSNQIVSGTGSGGSSQYPIALYQHSSAASNHQQVSDSARDKFFLTAADPSTEISPEERLKQVINAKLEAGLLQPYNYAKGYARLQGYMDNYMNQSSKQRILKPLSIFRPAFRAIARTLKDVDLILVEENFERMLLDYDRVFTSMAIPACLWRRTGEIYRGNKEFASLVEVNADDLRDGKLAIYELMSEESAVNFWEKYGAIAFDKGQKAVLTSCNLRTRDGRRRKTCCFSFTIRRDRYNIPSCIVGNFIPISP
ncbi:hypothetical protein BN7_3804 [Wickerhamomyces ciferrii]|uniref:ERT1/acuK family PAS domain-containing protein n=1 Tax=Wickerhamomyces ciferrii (strain ATCC 14091 / BCRC 22168 / CBS 111 / JCM 3599 / NBRC 0793 / NRRL Y-1031 F-60-10) TaxID=1206466 RepID=K0KSD8_WICCF|nr:uncharacterized protein BN7_3804 [Wickerhamomyces ciferrii]CCH44243.1 hypothetical protein BN7_3804 [Wickerhamomyces ciferrii]